MRHERLERLLWQQQYKDVQSLFEVRMLAVASPTFNGQLPDDRKKAHSAHKIPNPVQSINKYSIEVGSQLAEELRRIKLILWDEIVMSNRHKLKAVNRTFKDLLWLVLPFGGIALLYIGGFRQILPVAQFANFSNIFSTCFKKSRLFPLLERLKLHENMRLQTLWNDQNDAFEALRFFSHVLRLEQKQIQSDEKRAVPCPSFVIKWQSLAYMTQRAFLIFEQNCENKSWIAEQAVLITKNERLKLVNKVIGYREPENVRTFSSAKSVKKAEIKEYNYLTELSNELPWAASLSGHVIILKKGFMVVLLCSNQPKDGHVNEMRSFVNYMTSSVLFKESTLKVTTTNDLYFHRFFEILATMNFSSQGPRGFSF